MSDVWQLRFEEALYALERALDSSERYRHLHAEPVPTPAEDEDLSDDGTSDGLGAEAAMARYGWLEDVGGLSQHGAHPLLGTDQLGEPSPHGHATRAGPLSRGI
jgi:hypothetical protein